MPGTTGRKLSLWKMAVLLVLVPALLIIFSLLGLKWFVESGARSKARTLLSSVEMPRDDIDAIAIHLTSLVHKAFRSSDSNDPVPLLMAVRPYLSHRFVPAFLRIHPGAIDTLYLNGLCDNAARSLLYILNENGFKADQLNLVTPFSAHSVIVAETPGGRRLLLDPDKGVVPLDNDKILSPEQARMRMRNAGQHGVTWRGLSPSAGTGFYKLFATTRFARQGSRLEVEATVTLPGGKPVHLGKPDGSSEDVSNSGGHAGFSPYWHYIGSRYDRAWVRSLHFPQATRVTIVLTGYAKTNLITTDRQPEISGDKLIYDLKAGETLRFVDGKAGFDWFRLRSYQDVDYIRFDPVPQSG